MFSVSTKGSAFQQREEEEEKDRITFPIVSINLSTKHPIPTNKYPNIKQISKQIVGFWF